MLPEIKDLQIFAAFFRKFRVSNQCSFLIRSPLRKLKTDVGLWNCFHRKVPVPSDAAEVPMRFTSRSEPTVDDLIGLTCGWCRPRCRNDQRKSWTLIHHWFNVETSPTFGPFYVCQNPNLRCLNKSTLASLQGFSCHRMNGKALHLGDPGECKQFLDRISPQLHHLVAVQWNTLRYLRYTGRNTRRASSSPASEVSPPGSRSSMA